MRFVFDEPVGGVPTPAPVARTATDHPFIISKHVKDVAAIARDLEDGAALVAPLHDEHDELRLMLGALAARLIEPPGATRDEQVVVQIRDLTDLLRIHIRKEETLVFGLAERVLKPIVRAELAARRTPGRRPAPPDHPNTGSKGTCT